MVKHKAEHKAIAVPVLPEEKDGAVGAVGAETAPENKDMSRTAETVTTIIPGPETRKLVQITSQEAGGMGHLIEDEPYYHGYMSIEECEPILKKPGDFLVRKTEVANKAQYVISVRDEKTNIMHFLIRRINRLYYVYEYAFKTIPDLIAYHYRAIKPLNKDALCIKKAIRKSDWQLFHEQIEMSKVLGEGNFGCVYKGTLNLGVFRGRVPVAVKSLQGGSDITVDDRLKFLREANLMRRLSHKNVIRLYGVAAAKDPILVVMELAEGGSLLARVQDASKALDNLTRLKYCSEAACGLAYLESLLIIHRDVAARNCLLSEKGEVKISDFGLSLIGVTVQPKKKENLPIRHMAPECLRLKVYTSKSDVWSFGVTVWEVYTNGKEPYEDVQDWAALRKGVFKQKLILPKPESMPDDVEEIMRRCLKFSPRERPSFKELDEDLSKLFESQRPPPNIWQRLGLIRR